MEKIQYLTFRRVIRFMLACLLLGIIFSSLPLIRDSSGRQKRKILKSFDSWAKECVDTVVTSRKLIDIKRIPDAGQYLNPQYITAVKTLNAYKEVLAIAGEAYEHRVWKLAKESAMLNVILAMQDTVTFSDDVLMEIECQKAKVGLLKTIQGKTVTPDAYNVIGMAVHQAETAVSEISRQDGELVEIHVRYKGEKTLSHNFVFAKPVEACDLVFVGEFKMPAKGKKSTLNE